MSSFPIVESFPPAELPGAEPAAWVVRLSMADGQQYLCQLEGTVGAPGVRLDREIAPVVVADLLRPGWEALARPTTTPVVSHGALFRGFTLERPTTLGPAADPWRLRCLIPTPVAALFDWRAAAATLSAFSASILGELPLAASSASSSHA